MSLITSTTVRYSIISTKWVNGSCFAGGFLREIFRTAQPGSRLEGPKTEAGRAESGGGFLPVLGCCTAA